MLVLYCQTCCKGCRTYRQWISHLFSQTHQRKIKLKVKAWTKKKKQRAVLLTDLWKVNDEVSERVFLKLAWKVSEHTIISDFYFNGKKQFCLILIDEKKGADFIANVADVKVEQCRPFVRVASEVSANEWLSLFRKTKILSEENARLDTENDNPPEIHLDTDTTENFNTESLELYDEEEIICIDDDAEPENVVSLPESAEGGDIPEGPQTIVNNLPPDQDEDVNSALNEAFETFMKNNSFREKGKEIRRSIISEIKSIIRTKYAKATLEPFESGLEDFSFLKETAIMIGIKLFSSRKRRKASNKDMTKLTELFGCAKAEENLFAENVTTDTFQRGFTLHFTHAMTQIECQCIFYLKMSQQKLKFLTRYFEFDSRVRPLMKFLTIWYRVCAKELFDDLADEFQSPNRFLLYYPFMQLVLYFLIKKGIIPNALAVRKAIRRRTIMTRDINVVFHPISKSLSPNGITYNETPSANCILNLAEEFFRMFSHIDLKNNVISLQLGRLLCKSRLLNSENTINEEMKNCRALRRLADTYQDFVKKSKISSSSFVIQDILDYRVWTFSPNLSQQSVKKFQSFCKLTSEVVSSILCGDSHIGKMFSVFKEKDKSANASVYGFVSPWIEMSTVFYLANVPQEMYSKLKNLTRNDRSLFWGTTVNNFFDGIVKDILQCRIIPPRRNKLNEDQENQSDNQSSRSKRKRGISMASKRRKIRCSYINYNSVKITNKRVSTETYLLHFMYPELLSHSVRKEYNSAIDPKPADPLVLEKLISERYLRGGTNEQFYLELRFNVLTDFHKSKGGVRIEVNNSTSSENIPIVREMINLIDHLAEQYMQFCAQEFLKSRNM